MKVFAYLRVSTDEQDANSQKQGVEKFAYEHSWKIDEYTIDEGVSGAKEPSDRKLGELLSKVQKGDIIICSEISRLGRDLYMVMDILHKCMELECKIYTVKDKFVLGDDMQSKVLAFAFGLSAEIERQMIRQRTREGLVLRVKEGVLLGRPPGVSGASESIKESDKDKIIEQYNWGVPITRLAQNFKVHRNTMYKYLSKWEITDDGTYYKKLKEKENKKRNEVRYKDSKYDPVNLDKERCIRLIEADLTIPEIAKHFPKYNYQQVYDTIFLDKELNKLYHAHGQVLARKRIRR